MKNLGSEAGGVSRRDALKAFGAAGAAGAPVERRGRRSFRSSRWLFTSVPLPDIDGIMHPLAPHCCRDLNDGVPTAMNEFDFDIAHASFTMPPLAALLKFAPEDHILFATDFSPEPIESTVNELATSGLPPKLMAAIEQGNTEKLFPRFKV